MKKGIALTLCFALLFPCLTLFASCVGGGEPSDGFVVTFIVNGKKTKVTVPADETPAYPGDAEWESGEHYYKITGWEPALAPATANATYTANVGEYGLATYDIRFNMPNGIVLVKAHEGETPTPPKGYETDLQTEQVGTFDHWTPELVAPTAKNMEGKKFMMYTPNYNYSTRYYTVTFKVKGEDYAVKTAVNTLPVCPVDPATFSSVGESFVGWDGKMIPAREDATYTAWFGNDAEVLQAKDGAKGILTMTYDDGNLETARWVNQENKKYGLNGSCMLIAGRQTLSDNLAQWNALFADGTLEPQCHSMTHDVLPSSGSSHYADNKGNNTQPKYKYELVDSKKKLEDLFPDNDVICFASANGTLSSASFAVNDKGEADLTRPLADGGAQAVARDTYFAVRNVVYGIQSPNPTFGSEDGSWYNLKIQWFRKWWKDKTTNGFTWLDDTVKNGGWLIVLCHTVIGEGACITTVGNQDIDTELADKFFSYAGNYVVTGDLWCATFGDATKYLRERQGANAYWRMENGKLLVGLKLDRTTPDGKYLDENVFNYPLSVKVRVPSAWNSVSYELNGRTVTANVYTDSADGEKYVTVNAVPKEDGAVATTVVSRID